VGTTKLSIGSGSPRNCGVKNIGEFGNLNETWFESSIGFAPHTAPSMSGVRLLGNSGHVDIRRDPCCPAQSPALRLRAACSRNACCESSEGAFIAAVGRVRISANGGCKHSRAKWNPGVYVRNLPSIRLCVGLRGSREWRGCCPHPAR
jgi:hypothetical protein